MFSPKVKKYLIKALNDSPRHFYQAKGSYSGMAKCPTNPGKNSEVSCTLMFSANRDMVTFMRCVNMGTPLLQAASNMLIEKAKGSDVAVIEEASRKEYICNFFGVSEDLYESHGVWALTNAANIALSSFNDSKK